MDPEGSARNSYNSWHCTHDELTNGHALAIAVIAVACTPFRVIN